MADLHKMQSKYLSFTFLFNGNRVKRLPCPCAVWDTYSLCADWGGMDPGRSWGGGRTEMLFIFTCGGSQLLTETYLRQARFQFVAACSMMNFCLWSGYSAPWSVESFWYRESSPCPWHHHLNIFLSLYREWDFTQVGFCCVREWRFFMHLQSLS